MRPLLVVPGLFGAEIVDDELGFLWGSFRCLYGGPPLATLERFPGGPARILRGIPLVAGRKYDLLGALEQHLQHAGYRTDATLHFFAYDWRRRVVDAGALLARQIRSLAERAGSAIDLLGLSNGGPSSAAPTPPTAPSRSSGSSPRGRPRRQRRDGHLYRRRLPFRAARPARDGPSSSWPARSARLHARAGEGGVPPRPQRRLNRKRATETALTTSTTSRPGAASGCRCSADHPDDPVWIEVVAKRLASRGRAGKCSTVRPALVGWSASAAPACRRR